MLIIGIDGLRPDQFDPDLMPVVAGLAVDGVRFADFHSIYPPHTRAVMATMTTGTTPGRHGLIGNLMEDRGKVVDTSNWRQLVDLGGESGDTLLVPSLGDLLHARGERLAVAASSSGGVGMLWNPRQRDHSVNLNTTYGSPTAGALRERLGPVPARLGDFIELERARYVTRAVTECFLDDPLKRVIVLWIDELDHALHYTGVGSAGSIAVLRGIDQCIGQVLAALERSGLRESVDLFVLSDHGHTTLEHGATLGAYLDQAADETGVSMAEFSATGEFIYAASPPAIPDATGALIAWLVAQPWVDVVLTGQPELATAPGTVPLRDLWNGRSNVRAPLLAVATRWTERENQFGVPGHSVSLAGDSALVASHGTLSPWDMHGFAIAHGPSFRAGVTPTTPAGATDILPTVLQLLDLPIPNDLDGRVLHEALRASDASGPIVAAEILRDTSGDARVQLHRVGSTTYIHSSTQRDMPQFS